jgi:hypothetical protein
MSPTSTTLVERIAFEGPLHVAAVVALGLALCGLFAWSLRRERSVIGTRNVALFWTLRCTALGVALWMLLAPSAIRSQRSSTRPAIAVAVDVSGSMQTVDPPEPSDDLRWRLAAGGDATSSVVASADRALAAAAIAERRLADAAAALKSEQPEHIALAAAAAAQGAIERTTVHAKALSHHFARSAAQADLPDGAPSPAELQEQTAQVVQILDGSDFRNLARLVDAGPPSDALMRGWRESLTDLQRHVAAVRRRLAELSQSVGRYEGAVLASQGPAPVDNTAASRLGRAAGFLKSIDSATLQPLRAQADVHFTAFDRTLAPLGNQDAQRVALDARLVEKAAENGAGQGKAKQPAQDDLPATDLAAALEQLRQTRQDQPLAAVFLLTDAAHNRSGGRDPRQAAAQMSGTPVYVVPIGATRRVRDVDLKAVSAPGVAMKGDEVVIEATLEAYQCEGEILHVELLRDGAVVQQRELKLESSSALERCRFNAQLEEVGLARFQLRVTPLERELSEENNFEQFEVNVTRNHIELLLADELPRWEYRYLAQLFRRDEKVACDELLFRPRLIATGRREEQKAFPLTADEWNEYDVVLLGDVSSERLPVAAQESLVQFVRERGGTLVMIAGQESMPQAFVNQPLEELLPVSRVDEPTAADAADGYSFHVTEEGWRHHALMIADTEESTRIAWDFINRNSPLHSLSAYRQPRASARTLIAAVSRTSLDVEQDESRNALLCWQPVGRGRVVYLASPETYRLRFLHGDRLHYRFWGQLLRWAIAADLAAGSELVNIRTDRPDYRQGDRVQVAVRLKDEAGQPVLDAEIEAAAVAGGDVQYTVPLRPDESIPGRYVGAFEQLPSGAYRVEPQGDQIAELLQTGGPSQPGSAASFTVRNPLNRELLDTRSDRALARQIAEASGGQVLPPTAVSEVLALTDLKPTISEQTEKLPLWVQWKFLWLVFGCLFAEWAVRKRMGLS